MRRDLRVVRLRHASDLPRFQNAANAPKRHLQNGSGLLFEQFAELELGGQALAGGDGDGGCAGYAGHLIAILRRHRFLEPQWIVLLHPAGEANRAGGGGLAVGADKDVRLVAHRFAHGGNDGFGVVQAVQRRFAGVAVAHHVDERIELQRREAFLNVRQGACCGRVWVRMRGASRFVARRWPEVGVGTELVVIAPAKQVVDGLIEGLADDVPTRHFESAQDAGESVVRVLVVIVGFIAFAVVDISPEALYLEGIGADGVGCAHVLDHLGDRERMERRLVDLADANDAVVRLDLGENPMASAPMGTRCTHHQRRYRCDLHSFSRLGTQEAVEGSRMSRRHLPSSALDVLRDITTTHEATESPGRQTGA